MAVKLQQGQVWKQGKEYIRIVRLERLEVEYKSLISLAGKEGTRHVTSKKDFCRLLKQARLLMPAKTTDPLTGSRPPHRTRAGEAGERMNIQLFNSPLIK
jgi:hypothetical protein